MQAFTDPKVRKYMRREFDPELWFEDIVVLPHFVSGDYQLAGVNHDPDDDKYIAAAVEDRTALVVAGDVNLLRVKEHEGLRFVRPEET